MSWNILTYLCLTSSHIVIEIISSISSCQNYITVRVRGTSFCSIWYLLRRTSYYRFLISDQSSDQLARPGQASPGIQEIFGDKQIQFSNNWDKSRVESAILPSYNKQAFIGKRDRERQREVNTTFIHCYIGLLTRSEMKLSVWGLQRRRRRRSQQYLMLGWNLLSGLQYSPPGNLPININNFQRCCPDWIISHLKLRN